MLLEKKLHIQIRKFCKTRGWVFAKVKAVGKLGFPDLIVIDPVGHTYYLELKRSEDAARTEQQREWGKILLANNAVFYFIESFDQFLDLVVS